MARAFAPACVLPVAPQPAHLRQVQHYYEEMVVATMRTLTDRWDPRYPFVNTKLDLGSPAGEDFQADDPIRGRGAVYGWIQGRGLEALAGHCAWLRRRTCSAAPASSPSAEDGVWQLKLREMLSTVVESVQWMRQQNDGRLWFFMRPDDGTPFALREGASPSSPPVPFSIELGDRPLGFADVFTAKGLFSAAVELNDSETRADAVNYMQRVTEAIFAGPTGFANDQEVSAIITRAARAAQRISALVGPYTDTKRVVALLQPLDPKNPVVPIPGRHSHGPFMIQLGAAAALCRAAADDPTGCCAAEGAGELGLRMGDKLAAVMCLSFCCATSICMIVCTQGTIIAIDKMFMRSCAGVRLVQRCLDQHTTLDERGSDNKYVDFPVGSMWEYVDDDGLPYVDAEGQVVSDPGHALEFVGLGSWFLREARRLPLGTQAQVPDAEAILARLRMALPLLLETNFRNGFIGYGICKAFDLVAGNPTNTDMPWWSLPETMRAATAVHSLAPSGTAGDKQRVCADQVLSACHGAFAANFVRYDLPIGALSLLPRDSLACSHVMSSMVQLRVSVAAARRVWAPGCGGGMAYQTCDGNSALPVAVIPATADADPGYHTGLSVLAVIDDIAARLAGEEKGSARGRL